MLQCSKKRRLHHAVIVDEDSSEILDISEEESEDVEEAIEASRELIVDHIAEYITLARIPENSTILVVDDVNHPCIPRLVERLQNYGWPTRGRCVVLWGREPADQTAFASRTKALYKAKLLANPDPFVAAVKDLDDPIAIVDLHTTVYPLSALSMLAHLLCGVKAEGNDCLDIYLTCVVGPGFSRQQLMQRHVDKRGEQSPYRDHLELFRRWESLDVEREIIVDFIDKINKLLQDSGWKLTRQTWIEKKIMRSYDDERVEVFTYRELISESSTLMGCFHFVAQRLSPPSGEPPLTELLFDDMVAWRNHADLLYSDLTMTESILSHVRSNLTLITSPFYKTVLDEYEDPPLVVISKFISSLIPKGHPTIPKEFYNMVVSGTERLGKTPSLVLPVLIANSPDMRRIYSEAGQVLRTAIITGPNTLGPEQDLIAKFQRDIPKDLFRLHRLGGRGNAPQEMRRDSSHDGYVFGDSDGRAEVLRSMLEESTKGPDAQGKEIVWLLCIDEADHIFGRGWKPGRRPIHQTISLEGSWSKAEGISRRNICHPNVVCVNMVTATELSLYNAGRARVLSEKYKIHTLKLKTNDTYYGVQRLNVKHPLADKEDLDVGDGCTSVYNGIHRCLSEFNDAVPCHFEGKVIHPMMLICVTLKVDVPRGQKELAKALSLGEYQQHLYVANEDRWQRRGNDFRPPICVVYAGRIPTVYDAGIERDASTFLLEEYADDPDVFPAYMSHNQRASCARLKGDHLQTFLPLLMQRMGFHRKLILIGYSRLVRALTMSFTATDTEDNGQEHLFYITHAAFRVFTKPVKGDEYAMTCYSRCIEDIRQLLARSYSRTYGIDLDRAFNKRFEISVCTAMSVPEDIRANMRLSTTMTQLVGTHHDLSKAIKAIPVLPAELFGQSQHVMSTKRQTNVLQVKTKSFDRLKDVKCVRPTVYSNFVDTYDSLPSEARMAFVSEKNLIKSINLAVDQVQRETLEAYSHGGAVRIFAPGEFFGHVFGGSAPHNNPGMMSQYDFVTHIGTPTATRIKQQKQRSVNAPIKNRDIAVDHLTKLLAFSYDWQPLSAHPNEMAISLPMRRQGCLLAIASFGLSTRQKSYGLTLAEVEALGRFATYFYPDTTVRVLSSNTPLFNKMKDRYFLNDCLDVNALPELLSVYVTEITVLNWIDDCRRYTHAFLRFHATRIMHHLEQTHPAIYPTVDTSRLIIMSLTDMLYPLRGVKWNKWLWDEFAKPVSDREKQAEMEAWIVLLAPWKAHCSPTSARSADDIVRLGLLAGIIGLEYSEFGIPTETLELLLLALFGRTLLITDLLTSQNISTHEAGTPVFAADRPLTVNNPLLVESSPDLFNLHPIWSGFFADSRCPLEDSNVDAIRQLQDHIIALLKNCSTVLQHTYRIVLKPASRPTPTVPLPPLSYRIAIEADLAKAATLPREQWETMPLSAGKIPHRKRKFWKFFCHLFINNGMVVSTRNATRELIQDFLRWTNDTTKQGMPHHLIRYYLGAAPTHEDHRRVWRETATDGAAHVVEISSRTDKSVVYRIAWH